MKAGKPNKTREEALELVARGTWDGTAELVRAVADESRYAHGWRPYRAALVAVRRDLEADKGDRFWSAAAFCAWETEAAALSRLRGEGLLRRRLGLSNGAMNKARAEGVNKVLALACAHFTLGLPMPVSAGDARGLADWYHPRFGGVDRVADWLGISADWLSARLRGDKLIDGDRRDRLPPAWLIRALDWMFTVGPICPYGEKPFAPYWPDQVLAEEDY